MYFKIEDKTSKVYKDLYKLRSQEIEWNKKYQETVKSVVPYQFERFYGHKGQCGLNRGPEYVAFQFLNPEEVDTTVWIPYNVDKTFFTPNGRTRQGKEIKKALSSGRGYGYFMVHNILEWEKESCGHFTLPYVEIGNEGVIALRVDDRFIPKDEKLIIEITSKEFEQIIKE